MLTSILQGWAILSRKSKAITGVNFALSLLSAAVEVGIGLFLTVIIFKVGISRETPGFLSFFADYSLGFLVSCLIGVALFRGMVQFLLSHLTVWVDEVALTTLRFICFQDMLFGRSDEKGRDLSNITVLVTDIFQKATTFCYFFMTFLSGVIQCFIISIFLFKISFRLSMIGFGSLALVGGIMFLLNRKARSFANLLPLELRRLTKVIVRVSKNLLLLRALRTEYTEHSRLETGTMHFTSNAIRASFFGNLAAVGPQTIGIVVLALLLFAFGNSGQISGAVFLSFLYLYMRFVLGLGAISANMHLINIYFPHFKVSMDYIHKFPKDLIAVAASKASAVKLTGVLSAGTETKQMEPASALYKADKEAPAIVIENLSYEFEGTGNDLFKGLSKTITPGSQVGIFGPSGSGKSTLLYLIMGILEPVKGSIRICGMTPKRALESRALRVGYVGPEPFLVEGTLEDNLCYGLIEKPSVAAIEQVIKSVGLGHLLAEESNSLLTEAGEGLSTGQKQRISLARALLSEPQLLILDELSANLDETTELLICKLLEKYKGSMTCIIVSHRPAMFMHADWVLDMSSISSDQVKSIAEK